MNTMIRKHSGLERDNKSYREGFAWCPASVFSGGKGIEKQM